MADGAALSVAGSSARAPKGSGDKDPWQLVTPARPADIPDWRDPGCYALLLKAERTTLAWEWLRRSPRFRVAALEAMASTANASETVNENAREWGLLAFEDPRLAVPAARPLWAAEACGWVIGAVAKPAFDREDAFDLGKLCRFATLRSSEAAQHLLLSDGLRSIRLDVTGAPIAAGEVGLSFTLAGLKSLERPMIIISRLRSLAISGGFASSLYSSSQRTRRLVLMLRAFDAWRSGASHADVAEALLSNRLERRGWRIHSPSLRSQAQRLMRASRAMAENGYRGLLL